MAADYGEMADAVRFGDPEFRDDRDSDCEWWKDDGRDAVAGSIRTLVEEHKVPEDVAKEIVGKVFWAAMAEMGQ